MGEPRRCSEVWCPRCGNAHSVEGVMGSWAACKGRKCGTWEPVVATIDDLDDTRRGRCGLTNGRGQVMVDDREGGA